MIRLLVKSFNGIEDSTLVLSLPRIDCSVVLAVASSHLLLKTGDDVSGDFRMDIRSNMIIDNVSVWGHSWISTHGWKGINCNKCPKCF